jgi:hypothetical protein
MLEAVVPYKAQTFPGAPAVVDPHRHQLLIRQISDELILQALAERVVRELEYAGRVGVRQDRFR